MVDDPVRYLLHDRFDPGDRVHARSRSRRCGEGRIKSPAESEAMSDLALGAAGFGVLFVLIALRVPIGVGMIVVGMVGYASIAGTISLLSFLKTEMYWRFSSF